MKIAVLGGGFAGLSASYYLRKKRHKIVLFEKSPVLGGLAVGFKQSNWNWHLERAYHHLFANDHDILNFARDTGFKGIFFTSPITASLYNNSRIIPLDTPQDLLRFPYLSLPDKIRAGLVLAVMKISPFLPLYEQQTAKEFLGKYMGNRAWEVLFEELFRKKFGKYAGNILASFFWARINKRTKKLGYIKGGFQNLLDHIEKELRRMKVELRIGTEIAGIRRNKDKFIINGEEFDAVVSTLPSPVLAKVGGKILPKSYLARLGKLKFLHAITLILETKEKLLDKEYWLNLCTDEVSAMVAVAHTNMVDKKHYGGSHILYVANYIDNDSPLIKMSDKEVFEHYKKQLKKINPKFSMLNAKYHVFKGPFAQPVFDKEFLKNKPDFKTPVKNFYIANLDMTYPYDRGTNYAVRLGREVSNLIFE